MKNRALFALAFGLLLAASLAAQNPTFYSIDPPDSVLTRAFAINPRGDIVGLYFSADNVTHGFLFSHGHYTTIDGPNFAIRTNAIAINPQGQIVGRYDTPDRVAHGYIYANGVFETVDHPLAAGFTVVTDITPSGDIAGRYQAADKTFHGFVRINGEWTTIDHLDASGNPDMGPQGIQAMAINPYGLISGYYQDKNRIFHAFVLDRGVYTTIDPPGATNTGGSGGVVHINPEGTVAGGFYVDTLNATYGFIYSDGGFITFDLPDPGAPNGKAQLTTICGINPQGDVVGVYVDHRNVTHGYLSPRGTIPY
jgi:hypothetical protein